MQASVHQETKEEQNSPINFRLGRQQGESDQLEESSQTKFYVYVHIIFLTLSNSGQFLILPA